MRTIAVLTVMFLFPAGVCNAQESGIPPTEVWSIERLDLEVEIRQSEPRLKLRGTLTLELEETSSDGPTLGINSRKQILKLTSLTADGVEAKVFPFPDNPVVQVAMLDLPRTFSKGDLLEVSFEAESLEQSSQFVLRDDAAFASWVEYWYPVPATQKKGRMSPAAPGTTRFILPRGWRSVSNGRLSSSSVAADGRNVEEWTTDAPAARSFVAAPFVQVTEAQRDGRTIAFYLLKERESADTQAAALAGALTAMEKRLGPYPYATYNVAEVPEGITFAAASEQGFIMVRSSVLDDPRGALPLFAHEAGHGWWGNLVRPSGDGSKMLSEALAQYSAVFAIEALEGRDAMTEFLRFSREGYSPLQSALGYFFIWREGNDRPLSALAQGPQDHNLADSKGMWFYHMLRERVGDEIFFSTLRGLIRDFSSREFPDREVTLDDLRKAFTDASPEDRGLANFMSQWLDRPGAPVLAVDWWSMDRGTRVEVHISQLQGGEPYTVPLEVDVHTKNGGVISETLEISGMKSTFSIATAERPLDLDLDPHHKLLMWRPEFGPRPPVSEVKP